MLMLLPRLMLCALALTKYGLVRWSPGFILHIPQKSPFRTRAECSAPYFEKETSRDALGMAKVASLVLDLRAWMSFS